MKYREKRRRAEAVKERVRSVLKSPVLRKAGAVAAAAAVCFVCVYAWDSAREVETNEQGQKILRRNGQGEGDRSTVLKAEIEGTEQSVDITVSEEMYDPEEVRKLFDEAGATLDKRILGDNESLEEVRTDLEFFTQIPDTGIRVEWETDNHEIIDRQGKVYNQETPEDGVLVKLTANLSYEEEHSVCEFYARVFPEKISNSEKMMNELQKELKKADEENRTKEYMILPEEVEGRKVSWSMEKDNRAYAVLVIGFGAACMLCVSENQNRKEKEKKRIIQMKRDYPQIISKFNLYIGAGMTVRRAWFCIAGSYQEEKEQSGERCAYEEMVHTMNQIQSGAPEGECYEEFGVRCKITVYRKFGTMLSQNLRKGSKGITELLRKESEEAFEERKNTAKKLGEEAGTKMMIPLFMMLAVVFAIVIIPALFSVQI